MNAKDRERGGSRRKKRKMQNLHEVHNCVAVMHLAQRAATAAVEQQPLAHLHAHPSYAAERNKAARLTVVLPASM